METYKNKVKKLLGNIEILNENGIQIPNDVKNFDDYLHKIEQLIMFNTTEHPVRKSDLELKEKLLKNKNFEPVDNLKETCDWLIKKHRPNSYNVLKNLMYK